MHESEIKLGDAFNSMPGRKEVLEMLSLNDLSEVIDVIDRPEVEFWENKEDTLVFRLQRNCMAGAAVGLAQFAMNCGADEFDYVFDGRTGGYFIRFWWD